MRGEGVRRAVRAPARLSLQAFDLAEPVFPFRLDDAGPGTVDSSDENGGLSWIMDIIHETRRKMLAHSMIGFAIASQ